MKKLMALSVAAVMITATVNAQTDEVAAIKKDEASLKQQESVFKKEKREEKKELRKLEGWEVSYQAKQEFYKDFGDVLVTNWKRIADYDMATFTSDGQTMTAYYDADAKLVGTTSSKTFADLPSNAQKYINSKFSGYSKEGVVFFDDNEFNETDMILYGQQFADADNYFVELKKDNKTMVLEVNMEGSVIFYKQLN